MNETLQPLSKEAALWKGLSRISGFHKVLPNGTYINNSLEGKEWVLSLKAVSKVWYSKYKIDEYKYRTVGDISL